MKMKFRIVCVRYHSKIYEVRSKRLFLVSRVIEFGVYLQYGRKRWLARSRTASKDRRRSRNVLAKKNPLQRNRKNPLDRDGKVTSCMVCKSIYHYARECPNAEDRDSEITETYNSMDAQFTLFCAYTNSKLQDLTKECDGYAILDTGCANTVCGEEWMNKFIEKLSDEERERMTIESSDQSFTFGDGGTCARDATSPVNL